MCYSRRWAVAGRARTDVLQSQGFEQVQVRESKEVRQRDGRHGVSDEGVSGQVRRDKKGKRIDVCVQSAHVHCHARSSEGRERRNASL